MHRTLRSDRHSVTGPLATVRNRAAADIGLGSKFAPCWEVIGASGRCAVGALAQLNLTVRMGPSSRDPQHLGAFRASLTRLSIRVAPEGCGHGLAVRRVVPGATNLGTARYPALMERPVMRSPIPQTEAKLREAGFFLQRMMGEFTWHPGRVEPLRFYASAAQSAGRSVTFVLATESGGKYHDWYDEWSRTRLTEEQREFLQSMNDWRRKEVHLEGAMSEQTHATRHFHPTGRPEGNLGLQHARPWLYFSGRLLLHPETTTPPAERVELTKARTTDASSRSTKRWLRNRGSSSAAIGPITSQATSRSTSRS